MNITDNPSILSRKRIRYNGSKVEQNCKQNGTKDFISQATIKDSYDEDS